MILLKEEVFYLQFHNGCKVQPVEHRCYFRRKPYLCYRLEQSNGQELLKDCLLSKVPDRFSELDQEAAGDFPLSLQHIMNTMRVPTLISSLLLNTLGLRISCLS